MKFAPRAAAASLQLIGFVNNGVNGKAQGRQIQGMGRCGANDELKRRLCWVAKF